MIRAMAGTAVLEGYVGLASALARGSVTPAIAERVAQAVAKRGNSSGRPSGLLSIDPRSNAALRFAEAVLAGDGHVDTEALRAARAADLTDVELAEIVGHIALNLLTSYFNRAFEIDRDVPDPKQAPASGPPASARRAA